MLAEVKKTISVYNMLTEGDSVLVGLSGGPDSVCLLYVLSEYPIKLFIAHLNHGLRGKESDGDQRFCEELGNRLGIPVFTKKVNLAFAGKGAVKIRKSEDEARRVRYEFLEEAARRFGAKRIALGHNADDQVETVLMRLLRGAGVKGLGGIPPVRGLIIRPLINVWREEILDYLKKRGIPYRIDSTNLKLDYFRNRIRHELLPFLTRYNPNIKNVLLSTGRNTAMVNEYLEEVVNKEFEGTRVSIERLKRLHPAIRQELIRRIVHSIEPTLNLEAVHVDNVLSMGKKLSLPKGVKVIREYDKLIFYKGEGVKKRFEIKLPIPGRGKIPNSNIFITSKLCKLPKKIKRNLFEVMLDYDRILPLLKMRNRRPGDVFQPIGLEGKKKVKDIFIDEKIPERLRDTIPLVVSGKEICWIPGYRIGEKFKIGPRTKRVVKINAQGVKKLWQS